IPNHEHERLASDVIFAGGGDADRVPYIAALRRAGFRVALYGGYWDRFPETRGMSRGLGDLASLRRAMAATKGGLCMVRRQNRDGHCMRTFEVPAFGACMLAEWTEEHLDLFGPDGSAVTYFRNTSDMVEKVHWLVSADSERARLAAAAHDIVLTQ